MLAFYSLWPSLPSTEFTFKNSQGQEFVAGLFEEFPLITMEQDKLLGYAG